ncbi:flagellar hook-basal body protein [Vampirovibrio sp.]|uniref:flagellar hook-basal body protein n=1 Tax=Vampirovibrio sp. TaxID=2717857 RepID=UPI0035933A7B
MLDVIMRLAANNAGKQFQSLGAISNNIANFNTTGYKAQRFEQYLTSDDRMENSLRVDASKGLAMITKRELDVSIDGFGYIPVTQPDGVVAYTRDGSFALNSEGIIVTNRGDIVADGIKVPINYENIQIQKDGEVRVKVTGSQTFQPIGKITMARFANPETLKSLGYNKLTPTPESGQPMVDTESKISQGTLERSNVSIHGQIDQILRLNASLISNIRIIKFADDLYRQSVNLKQ